VRQSDAKKYGEAHKPLQLRLRNEKGKEPLLTTRIMNFGESKGLEANHVFIYPTGDMLKWLNGSKVELKFKTKAQLYVALTRAFFSVGILVEDTFKTKTNEIQLWNPNTENFAIPCIPPKVTKGVMKRDTPINKQQYV
jgi:superfamily I DNA/RNA helicase